MPRVLVLNAGSSTLKASLVDETDRAVSSVTTEMRGVADAGAAFSHALQEMAGASPHEVTAVGHRVVHGGARFTSPTVVDARVLDAVRGLASVAPLHNPVALAVIESARDALPAVPHVAVFDTAFHATLPPEAYLYALPRPWYEEWGYRRFGFHGISCAWATERAAALLGRSVDEIGIVVAHLGAGCSVTAVWRGRSVATSMGMTPLEGLVMATRSGSVDPGVLLAAQREHGLGPDALADVLEHRSGLVALAGSADVRALLARAPSDPDVALALAVFARSAAAGIASAATALPRLDALVFTGGIGEHAAELRSDITRRLTTLDVPSVSGEPVETDAILAASPVAVLRVEAREDVVIARAARRARG